MKKIGLWLIALYLILYIIPLGSRALLEPDEVRYGTIAREIIESGDWVVPRINGLRYFEKPIMGHWGNALAQLAFGQNNFAVRIASAVATGFSALLLFLLVRREPENRDFALGTTAVFLSCALVYFVGTFSVLDAMFSAWVTATLVFFYCGAAAKSFKERYSFLVLAGITCGCAFLTKGLLAFAIPGITIIAWLIWEKRYRDIFILPWIPLILVVLTIAPWSYLVHLRDNDFWRYFIVVEHFQRFSQDVESQHPEPFWFFIPVLLGGTIPWIFLIPGLWNGYRGKFKELFRNPLMRYAACWLVLPFLLMSASSGKLGPYILPCFPAVALLIAVGLREYLKIDNLGRSYRVLIYILVSVAAVALIGLTVLEALYFSGVIKFAVFDQSEIGRMIIAIVAIAIFGFGLMTTLRQNLVNRQRLIFFGLSVLPIFFAWHFVMPNLVANRKAPGKFINEVADRITPETIVVSYKNHVAALAWFLKRDDIYVYGRGGELTYGLNKSDAAGRLLSKEDFEKMIKNKPAGQRVVIFHTSKRQFNELPPSPNVFIRDGNYFAQYN